MGCCGVGWGPWGQACPAPMAACLACPLVVHGQPQPTVGNGAIASQEPPRPCPMGDVAVWPPVARWSPLGPIPPPTPWPHWPQFGLVTTQLGRGRGVKHIRLWLGLGGGPHHGCCGPMVQDPHLHMAIPPLSHYASHQACHSGPGQVGQVREGASRGHCTARFPPSVWWKPLYWV